jgi:hypothetical protein
MVLAADSRMTIVVDGQTVFVSDNDMKLLELQSLPIGVLTCGSRSVQGRPIASWIEDFSRCLPDGKTVEGIAQALADYIPAADEGSITLLVAGYDRAAQRGADGQIFTLNIANGLPTQVSDHSGFFYRLDGDFDAVTRLLEGRSFRYVEALAATHPDGQAIARNLDELGWAKARVPLYAMTLRDGIELVEFWVHTQIVHQKFSAQPQTCGGPIDIAAISPGQFQWVRRKP